MDRLIFENISELAEYMDNYVTVNSSKDEYPIISVYANYEIAKGLVEKLIAFGNNIGSILELESYEMSHYDKEYCVYLTEDGVTCEKEYHENSYYNGGGDISFVHEDCNSKLLNHIDSKTIYEFAVDDDNDECGCDECECDCCGDIHIETDGDMHGFSVNHSGENGWSSYSFYSTDIDLVNEMAKMFR